MISNNQYLHISEHTGYDRYETSWFQNVIYQLIMKIFGTRLLTESASYTSSYTENSLICFEVEIYNNISHIGPVV